MLPVHFLCVFLWSLLPWIHLSSSSSWVSLLYTQEAPGVVTEILGAFSSTVASMAEPAEASIPEQTSQPIDSLYQDRLVLSDWPTVKSLFTLG